MSQMGVNKQNGDRSYLLQDVAIVVISVLVAVLLVRTNTLANLLTSTEGMGFWGAFVAGMFFTSLFTTAPAMAALGEVSLLHGILYTAVFGALGSVVGDLIIFRFMRDRFSDHIAEMLTHQSIWRRLHLLFKRRVFRWGTLLVGGLILASPLPDELGITVLGFSKMRMGYFAELSFVFNFLGILVIGLVARSFVG